MIDSTPPDPGARRAPSAPRHPAARRVTWLVALVAAALLGSIAVLLTRERLHLDDAARRTAVGNAEALQDTVSGLLAQSATSLSGIRTGLHGRVRSDAAARALLSTAMSFDPLSEMVGVVSGAGADRHVDAIGRGGQAVAPQRLAGLDPQAWRHGEGGIGLAQLVRLPGDAAWYLPVTLPMDERQPGAGLAFALIPVAALVRATAGLPLARDGYVAVAMLDGRRLFRCAQGELVGVNGPPVPERYVDQMRRDGRGAYVAASPFDGRQTLYGYSVSSVVPLIVASTTPTRSLWGQWLQGVWLPVLALSGALAGTLVFGLRLRRATLAQARQVAHQHYLATHDRLTGLLNREAFLARLESALQRVSCGRLVVILTDLHRFREINDTLGHEAGDEVLTTVSARLADHLRGRDVAMARVGSDELAVFLCDDTLPEGAGAICESLHAGIIKAVSIGDVALEVGASMGVAIHDGTASAPELLRHADIALQSAREAMGRYAIYNEALDTFSAESLALRAEFAQALRDGALTLAFQPKFELASGRLSGVEALARWVHPLRGPIPPGVFVPHAEQSELIHPFTRWVLDAAIAQAARWHEQGRPVAVAVNISPLNLLDADFAGHLQASLARHRLPARWLELELTETALMREPELALRRLTAIRELGVGLSIDDFGTGWASLSYLKRLPVTALKVDRSFVAELDNDPLDQRIVRGIVSLAHDFGLEVVAEGVETPSCVQALRAIGCDHGQGYLLARPLSAADLEAQWLDPSAAQLEAAALAG